MASDERDQNEVKENLDDDQVTLSTKHPENQGEASADGWTESGEGEFYGQSVQDLQAEIEALKDEMAMVKEQSLRAAAEAQNARRRAEQDIERAHKFALEKFVSDLLPVADNLERSVEAAEAAGGELKAVSEGVELTLKTLINAFKRHNVEMLYPEGEPFDPQLHQAMSIVEQADVEANTVVNVFQKGYTLNGRLVRPAMVVVAKSPASQSEKASP